MDLIIELKPAEKPGKAQPTVNKSSQKAACSGATQDHTIFSAYHLSTGPMHSGKIITCISQVGHRGPESLGKCVAPRGAPEASASFPRLSLTGIPSPVRV